MDTLTIGDNEGVPFEMARLINNIFCLSEVRINGVRYVRSESSVPERQVIAERYPLFDYTFNVERADNISFNGFTEQSDGSWVTGSISVNVANAKDGRFWCMMIPWGPLSINQTWIRYEQKEIDQHNMVRVGHGDVRRVSCKQLLLPSL